MSVVDAMTREVPAERPSAVEALDLWRSIRPRFEEASPQQRLHTYADRIRRAALNLSLFVCLVLLGVRMRRNGTLGDSDMGLLG